jgi:hypothetical protein
VAREPVDDTQPVVAVRAAYAALLLGIIGGLGLATVVFSGRIIGPMTLADTLGIEPPTADLDKAGARRSRCSWAPAWRARACDGFT